MAAAAVYMKLLRSIEDSQLNYSMSKTPFSATISLKSSFLKRFPKDIHDVKIEKKEEAIEEEKLKHKDEIFKLQNTFEDDRKIMIAEIERLQNAYDVEKQKSAALEQEIAEFRNEVLRVKKEKKELNLALKGTKEKFEAMENHSSSLVDDKKALHMKLAAEIRNVDRTKSEINNIMKESENIVNELEKVQAELVEVKSKELR